MSKPALKLNSNLGFEKVIGLPFFLKLEKFAQKLPGQYKLQLQSLIAEVKASVSSQYKKVVEENGWLKQQNAELVKGIGSKVEPIDQATVRPNCPEVPYEEVELLPLRSDKTQTAKVVQGKSWQQEAAINDNKAQSGSFSDYLIKFSAARSNLDSIKAALEPEFKGFNYAPHLRLEGEVLQQEVQKEFSKVRVDGNLMEISSFVPFADATGVGGAALGFSIESKGKEKQKCTLQFEEKDLPKEGPDSDVVREVIKGKESLGGQYHIPPQKEEVIEVAGGGVEDNESCPSQLEEEKLESDEGWFDSALFKVTCASVAAAYISAAGACLTWAYDWYFQAS